MQYCSVSAMISDPLVFHTVHNKRTKLSADRRQATCTLGYDGICFSHRPIPINKRIHVQIMAIGGSSLGSFLFGFTSQDPDTLDPDALLVDSKTIAEKPGYWVRWVPTDCIKPESVLFFCVKQNGQFVYGMAGNEAGVLMDGIPVEKQLWAIIHLWYGSVRSVKLVDECWVPQNE